MPVGFSAVAPTKDQSAKGGVRQCPVCVRNCVWEWLRVTCQGVERDHRRLAASPVTTVRSEASGSLQGGAARYKGQADAVAVLSAKVRNGGTGNWGQIRCLPRKLRDKISDAGSESCHW